VENGSEIGSVAAAIVASTATMQIFIIIHILALGRCLGTFAADEAAPVTTGRRFETVAIIETVH
jgi:hypothetical protein